MRSTGVEGEWGVHIIIFYFLHIWNYQGIKCKTKRGCKKEEKNEEMEEEIYTYMCEFPSR